MAVLRESPWYQEILLQGEQRGEQRGAKREAVALNLRLLARRLRLDSLPAPFRTQVEQLSLPQLEALSEALLDFQTLADLEMWLQSSK
jgi:predicted transposase YdaD